MVQILLVRHGETDSNKSNIIMGHSTEPLNENGKEQARKCGLILKENFKSITTIFSSPLLRAAQTIEIIKEQLNFSGPINYIQSLAERDFGEFTGLTYEEVVRKFKVMEEKKGFVGNMDINLKPNGGESYLEFYSRSRIGFESLLTTNNWKDNETIVILSHGGTIRHILAFLLLHEKESFNDFPIAVKNCSITSFDINNIQELDVKINFMNYYQYLN